MPAGQEPEEAVSPVVAQKSPAGHATGEESPTALHVAPAGQLEHDEAETDPVKVPEGQLMQELCPDKSW